MAELGTGDTEAAADPAVLLQSLEKKAIANKYLFIGVLSFTGIVVAVMATALTVMYLKIASLTAAAAARDEAPYEEQFVALEKQLMLLADFRKSELRVIEEYTGRLDNIASNCDVSKAAPYRDFLLSREGDFQRFLETLMSGTNSLAKMSQGSRQWLEGYNTEIERLKQSSLARSNQLELLVKPGGKP